MPEGHINVQRHRSNDQDSLTHKQYSNIDSKKESDNISEEDFNAKSIRSFHSNISSNYKPNKNSASASGKKESLNFNIEFSEPTTAFGASNFDTKPRNKLDIDKIESSKDFMKKKRRRNKTSNQKKTNNKSVKQQENSLDKPISFGPSNIIYLNK